MDALGPAAPHRSLGPRPRPVAQVGPQVVQATVRRLPLLVGFPIQVPRVYTAGM